MVTIRVVEDWIEFDGMRIAKLLPNLFPTLLYRIDETFEETGYDLDDLDDLLDLLDIKLDSLGEKLDKVLGRNKRAKSLVERMTKARMRVVKTESKDNV